MVKRAAEAVCLTGAATGKIKLNSRVKLLFSEWKELPKADTFIHLKGFSRAKVTHLDVEHPELEVLAAGDGGFFTVRGVDSGLEVKLSNTVGGAKAVRIESPLLKEIIRAGETTRTWVGGKTGGFYIGFRKPEITKLEKLAQRLKSRR